VVSTFAGLRPLLAASASSPSETSREHEVRRRADGVLVVAGGKLTTLRLMAEQTVDRIVELCHGAGIERDYGPCTTRTRPLPGGGGTPDALARHELGPDVSERLRNAYGSRVGPVLAILGEEPASRGRLDPKLPYLWAEVVHAARHEQARTLTDVLTRRIPLFRDAGDQGLGVATRAAELVGRELGWDDRRRAREVDAYRASVEVSRRWRGES
jgi:glycerol-3-phosphate dehydrogenase